MMPTKQFIKQIAEHMEATCISETKNVVCERKFWRLQQGHPPTDLRIEE